MARSINAADYGIDQRTASREGLTRRLGGPREEQWALFPWLRPGVVYFEDDFLVNTAANYTLTKDTNATSFAQTAASNGTFAGSTGTTNTDGHSLLLPKCYKGSLNCGMEINFSLDVVTSFTLEAGFIDTVTDKTTPAVTDVDVPTIGAGNAEAAVITLDTSQTLTTAALVTQSTSIPYSAQKSNLGTFTPTAATNYVWRVQLVGTTVYGAIYGTGASGTSYLIAEASLTSAISSTALVAPWVAVATKNTTAKALSIDLLRCWQDRS